MREAVSIIGSSAALAHSLEQVSRVATINRPVLVLGSRGTGKELIADRLHFLSPRWDSTLDKVNCAAIADSLLESELFGHEPGAFTGATRTHRGRFERADGGTLFLDELATMSMRLQEKLLRLVEYGEFERLGGQETLSVDVRIVAATHTDLRQLAERGEFREDLLDRLSFDVVHLPSLAQRAGDIPELAEHFAFGMCAELGWELFPGFTERAMETLYEWHWPGNVRELKNVVERSIYRWEDPNSQVDEIILDPFVCPFAAGDAPSVTPASPDQQKRAPATAEPRDFQRDVSAYERDILLQSLELCAGHQGQAAERLALSYDQMRGLLRKHGIRSRRPRNSD